MKTRLHAALVMTGALSAHPWIATADPVLDWNAILVRTVASQNPFAQARFAAIMHLAVFEAVNAITRDNEPYLGTIASNRGASSEAAAVAAAHTVLRAYFPDAGVSLDAARVASLAGLPDGPAKVKGIAVGEAAAAAMIAARSDDGSTPPQFHVPESSDPGVWQPTPSCPPAGGVFLHWRNVTPFGIKSARQITPSLRTFEKNGPPLLGLCRRSPAISFA